jgi:hypothetical protein
MGDDVDATALELDRFAIGRPVPRPEDPVLLRGEGRYPDDVSLSSATSAVMVRSHYARGAIRRSALPCPTMPGVPRRPDQMRLLAGSELGRLALDVSRMDLWMVHRHNDQLMY